MSWDNGLPTAMELEERFSAFVLSYGGERVADLLQKKRELPLNADYLLWNRSVVAELKTITADHFADPKIGRKMLALSQQWVRDGLIPPLPPGRGIVSTEGLPLEQKGKAYAILTEPMRAASARASRQMRETKEWLKLPNAKGLLIIANIGDRSLAPKTALHYLEYVLARHTRTIHSFIFFSPTFDPRQPNVPLGLWMSGSTAHPDGGVADELINGIGAAWHEFVTEGSGVCRINLPASYLR